MLLRPLVISASTYPEALLALQDLLAERTALLPLPGEWRTTVPDLPAAMRAMDTSAPIAPGSLVVSTSGSTGAPKGAILTPAQLRASHQATAAALEEATGRRPGPWLLALPGHHIAGIQVALRSLRAGFTPHLAGHLATETSFTAAGFVKDAEALAAEHPAQDRYTSLVPAQLERLATEPRAVAALRSFTAVLVGGAATRPGLLAELRAAGAPLVTTYGSSETAGGIVYDGRPLPGASVHIARPDARGAGRVVLAGPMIAPGYRNLPGHPAFPAPDTFVTTDIGIYSDATLSILGRADGAVNTGGYKVLPEDVERALAEHLDGVEMVGAGGVEDKGLGKAIWALVEFTPNSQQSPGEITERVREALRGKVPAHLNPQRVWAVKGLPRTGPGKLDRRRVAEMLHARKLHRG